MKKSLVLLVSILFGVSAYASIPIIDASSLIETQSLSSGLLEVVAASMDSQTLIAALLCLFLGTLRSRSSNCFCSLPKYANETLLKVIAFLLSGLISY